MIMVEEYHGGKMCSSLIERMQRRTKTEIE